MGADQARGSWEGRYVGVGPNRGRTVKESEALAYACGRCGVRMADPAAPLAESFGRMLTEWYFSGNWIKEEQHVF